MPGAVFLDRDGVLNEVVWRNARPASPRVLEELVLVADLGALRRLRVAGLRIFVVTNQPDVARGLLDRRALLAMMARVRAATEADDVRCCVHDDEDGCACRKPRPGMLHDLAKQWSVDLASSYMVGDSWRDIEAGRAAGCRTLLLHRPYNAGVTADLGADTLGGAVDAVLADRERS
jgi:D-glycero-D-manno-heptose 1,7-bisphosphate phosphatase